MCLDSDMKYDIFLSRCDITMISGSFQISERRYIHLPYSGNQSVICNYRVIAATRLTLHFHFSIEIPIFIDHPIYPNIFLRCNIQKIQHAYIEFCVLGSPWKIPFFFAIRSSFPFANPLHLPRLYPRYLFPSLSVPSFFFTISSSCHPFFPNFLRWPRTCLSP